jgi:hypothetical protein
MRNPTIISLAALVLVSAVASAQSAPANFAGRWVQTGNSNPTADGGGFGGPGGPGGRGGGRGNPQGAGTFGNDFVAVQDAKTLTIKRVDTQTNDTLSSTYNLDGTESAHKALFGGGYQPAQSKSTAKWEGKELVITSYGVDDKGERTGGENPRPIVTRLWLNGNKLMIQTKRPQGNGGQEELLAILDKRK